MTEAEWLACNDPDKMLDCLDERLGYCFGLLEEHTERRAIDRRFRLFAVACCRRIWHLITDDRSRAAVEVAEKFAARLCGYDELNSAFGSAQEVLDESWPSHLPAACAAELATLPVGSYSQSTQQIGFAGVAREVRNVAGAGEQQNQVELLRDIFGNPFCPVTVDPTWRTAAVTSLAQAIYDDRAFDRLPILADALEDAGCTNQDILEHCRSGGDHVRGCWVVDLLLAKE
jgi:hypothetical protein